MVHHYRENLHPRRIQTEDRQYITVVCRTCGVQLTRIYVDSCPYKGDAPRERKIEGGYCISCAREMFNALERLDSRMRKQISDIIQIHEKKNHDYSSGQGFGNFTESMRVGITPEVGAFVRLQDKYTRACNLIHGKEPQVEDERLSDTLLDLAAYALIVRLLGEDE